LRARRAPAGRDLPRAVPGARARSALLLRRAAAPGTGDLARRSRALPARLRSVGPYCVDTSELQACAVPVDVSSCGTPASFLASVVQWPVARAPASGIVWWAIHS